MMTIFFVLDIDDTFDRVHGGQQLRLFNAFHDDYGFQPIVVHRRVGRASRRAPPRSAHRCCRAAPSISYAQNVIFGGPN